MSTVSVVRAHRFHILLIAVAASVGCRASLPTPAGVRLHCEASSECPSGYICNPNTQLCLSDKNPDTSVPAVVPPVTLSPSVGNESTTFSVTFATSEALPEPPVVYFDDGGTRHELTFSQAATTTTNWTFTYVPDGSESQRALPLSIHASDAAGNTLDGFLGANIVFDFTAPAMQQLALLWEPPPDSRLRLADALLGGGVLSSLADASDGAQITVNLALDAPLDPATQIQVDLVDATSHLAVKSLTFQSQSGSTYSFAGVVDATMAEGSYVARVRAQDQAGNVSEAFGTKVLHVDRSAPSPADVTTPDRTIYARIPYGKAGVPSPAFTVTGTSLAVEANAYVFGLAAGSADAAALGATRADSNGAFSLSLAPIDRPEVYLMVLDGAGNTSAVAKVLQVAWTGTLGNKRAGSVVENPLMFWDSQVFSGNQLVAPATERGASDGLAKLTCDTSCNPADSVVTSGNGYWSQVVPAAPYGDPPRTFVPYGRMAVAFDPVSHMVLALGGQRNGMAGFGETWGFDGTQWKFLTSAGPPTRYGARMAFDANLNRVLLFGGQQNTLDSPRCAPSSADYNCSDLWSWNGASWIVMTITGTPPTERANPGMAFDANRSRTVIYGGNQSTTILNDTYELACASGSTTCTSTSYASAPTTGRTMMAMTYDARTTAKRVLMFGGANAQFSPSTIYSDLWQRSGTTWSQVAASAGNGRYDSSLMWDADRQAVMLFGLADQGAWSHCAAPWLLSGSAFVCPSATVVEGASSANESNDTYAVYDSWRKQVVVFGKDLGGATYIWKNGVADAPGHVFTAPLSAPLQQGATVVDRINFQPSTTPVPAGYIADSWQSYGPQSNGRTYGWACSGSASYCPSSSYAVQNNCAAPSEVYDTYVLMQCVVQNPVYVCTWEYALPNGLYHVQYVLGDSAEPGDYAISIEGTPVSGTTTTSNLWLTGEVTVNVTDGKLTIANQDFSVSGFCQPNSDTCKNKLDALTIIAAAPVDMIDLTWYGGATSTSAGVQLLAYDGTAWASLGTFSGGIPALATLHWTSASQVEAAKYLLGEDMTASFALRPAGVNGVLASYAQVATDYVELSVRYRLP